VAVFLPFVAVGELQGATLSLVAGTVRVRGIVWKVEAVQRCVAGASVASEEEPGLFLLLAGVEELELTRIWWRKRDWGFLSVGLSLRAPA
jgi:hypothetical protein